MEIYEIERVSRGENLVLSLILWVKKWRYKLEKAKHFERKKFLKDCKNERKNIWNLCVLIRYHSCLDPKPIIHFLILILIRSIWLSS